MTNFGYFRKMDSLKPLGLLGFNTFYTFYSLYTFYFCRGNTFLSQFCQLLHIFSDRSQKVGHTLNIPATKDIPGATITHLKKAPKGPELSTTANVTVNVCGRPGRPHTVGVTGECNDNCMCCLWGRAYKYCNK